MKPGAARGPTGFELIGLGAALAGALLVPLVLGIVAGNLLGSPLWVFLGLFVGIGAAGFALYRGFKQYL
ncbi:MAG TPA: hypothetical protein VF137_05905 [Candidatus Dormibacteraeota bacterium]